MIARSMLSGVLLAAALGAVPAAPAHANGPCPNDVVIFFSVGGVETDVEGTRVSGHLPNAAATCETVGQGIIFTVIPGATHAKTRLTTASEGARGWILHGPIVANGSATGSENPTNVSTQATVYEGRFAPLVPTASGSINAAWSRTGANPPGGSSTDVTYNTADKQL